MPNNRRTMDAIELISRLGGPTACARLTGVKPPSVCEWKNKNSIPADKHVLMSVEAERIGIANRRDLRPNDYWLIWPDLPKTG